MALPSSQFYELVSVDDVRALLDYDPEHGVLIWKERYAQDRITKGFNTRCAGKEAGSVDAQGYIEIRITVPGKPAFNVKAHRIVYALHVGYWPDYEIDHKDGDKQHNKFENLRRCESSENAQNAKMKSTNTSGFKGVSWFSRRRKFVAQIAIRGKNKELGRYDTAEEAARVYDAAALKYHGEFAKTNAAMGLLG